MDFGFRDDGECRSEFVSKGLVELRLRPLPQLRSVRHESRLGEWVVYREPSAIVGDYGAVRLVH